MTQKLRERLVSSTNATNGSSLANLRKMVGKANSGRQLTPIQALSEEQTDKSPSESSSQTDEEGKQQYKKSSRYLALPAHVREAIDKVKMKGKHSDFYGRLKSLNTKIRVYQHIFYTRAPAYERTFHEKRRQYLEAKMRQEQNDLEQFVSKQRPKQHAHLRLRSHLNVGVHKSANTPQSGAPTQPVLRHKGKGAQNSDLKDSQTTGQAKLEGDASRSLEEAE